MRKVLFPLAFVGISFLAACSFSLKAGSGAQPQNAPPSHPTQPPAATQPAPTAAPAPQKPVASGPIRHIGRRPAGQPSGPTPAPTNTSTAPAPGPTTPPAPPASAQVVNAATIFGSGNVDPNGFKGTLYWVDKNTTKMPPLQDLKPAGFLFASELNVAPQAFTTGFPGVDPARRESFAIRYEAPLVITAEADYDFRLVADDAAILRIDSTPIVDNDGVKAAPAEKSGPVHLVAGTHLVQVDYLETTGPVALQLFWKKANDAEAVFHPAAAAAALAH
jgi:hypothetical protein